MHFIGLFSLHTFSFVRQAFLIVWYCILFHLLWALKKDVWISCATKSHADSVLLHPSTSITFRLSSCNSLCTVYKMICTKSNSLDTIQRTIQLYVFHSGRSRARFSNWIPAKREKSCPRPDRPQTFHSFLNSRHWSNGNRLVVSSRKCTKFRKLKSLLLFGSIRN